MRPPYGDRTINHAREMNAWQTLKRHSTYAAAYASVPYGSSARDHSRDIATRYWPERQKMEELPPALITHAPEHALRFTAPLATRNAEATIPQWDAFRKGNRLS